MAATFRPAPRAYVIYFVIGSPCLATAFILGWMGNIEDMIYLFVLFACYLSVSYFWLSRIRLTLEKDSISYRSLLHGTRSLKFVEIKYAETRTGIFEYLDRFKPFIRVEVFPYPESKKKPLVINIIVFSPEAAESLYSFLGAKMRGI